MTELYEFSTLLSDVAPSIELIEGRVFLDRFNIGVSGLREKIARYPSVVEAQKWMNMAPIDDLLDFAVSDWLMDDPALENVVAVFRRSWLTAVRAKCGPLEGITVELLRDYESGDIIVRLSQV